MRCSTRQPSGRRGPRHARYMAARLQHQQTSLKARLVDAIRVRRPLRSGQATVPGRCFTGLRAHRRCINRPNGQSSGEDSACQWSQLGAPTKSNSWAAWFRSSPSIEVFSEISCPCSPKAEITVSNPLGCAIFPIYNNNITQQIFASVGSVVSGHHPVTTASEALMPQILDL
jgi:hypothetical protein